MAKEKPVEHRVRGKASYPRLDTPDTKYNKHGTYKANVVVPLADAKPMIDKLQAQAKAYTGSALPLKKNSCWEYEKTPINKETGEGGDETGNVVFKIAAKNREVKDKRTGEVSVWDRKPAIFDGTGKLVKKRVKIGGGTEYAVVFTVYEGKDNDGNKTMSLQPVAVQVFKLVEYVGNGEREPTAEELGLSSEEGGWSAGDDDDADDDASDDTSDTSSDDTTTDVKPGEEDF